MTNTATISPTAELHNIDDIRALSLITATRVVNRRGEAIEGAVLQRHNEERRGWVCLPCDVSFQRWEAVEAHLKQPLPNRTPTDRGL